MSRSMTKSPRMGMSPWSSRGPMSAFREEMEDMFENLWEGEGDGGAAGRMLAAPLDLSETDTSIQIRMDLPGIDPKDIDIKISGSRLTISGERKEEKEEKGETFHRVERRSGRFTRSITLPSNVKEDDIDASYRDGVLTVSLPKSEEVKTKRIKVKAK